MHGSQTNKTKKEGEWERYGGTKDISSVFGQILSQICLTRTKILPKLSTESEGERDIQWKIDDFFLSDLWSSKS